MNAPHCDHLGEDASDELSDEPKKLLDETTESNVSIVSQNSENQTPNTTAMSNEHEESQFEDPLEKYLGTRPTIPSQYDLSTDYNSVMEIFYLCTCDLPEDRPTAGYLAKFLSKIVE